MLWTIANLQPHEVPSIIVYQTTAPETKPEEPPAKARVQLSSFRPKLPSTKLIKANTSSPIVIQTPQVEVPPVDFEIGSDVEGLDFGNGGSGQGGGNGKKGSLGGMDITANQLGVVLDVSGSMSGVLPDLEKEIGKDFPWALTERVTGCSISGDITQPGEGIGTLAAIKYLVETGEADAIFWFCDLQDSRDPDSVLSLGKYLKEKKVKLYLSSTEESPDDNLRKAVTKFSRWK